MLRRSWSCGMALVIGTVLMAGCRSVSPRLSIAPAEQSANSLRHELEIDRPAQQIAEAHAHYAAGSIHELNNESEAALHEYYLAALNDPGDESLILEVSRRFLQARQPDKALEILNRAAVRPDASGSIFAQLGRAYYELGKYEQAVSADNAAIRKAPVSLAGYHNLFLNYLQIEQPEEALKVLDNAAKQSKPNVEFLIGLGELYIHYGLQQPHQKKIASAGAIMVLNRAQKLNPAGSALRLKLAEDLDIAGDPIGAAQLYLDLLNKLADLPPVQERIRAKLADIYLRGSDRKRAVEQLEAIIREDPTNPQAYYYLGSLEFDEKKLPEAVGHFSKTVQLSPGFEPVYYDLAITWIGLNKPADALAILAAARQKFPQNFVMEFWTALAFARQKAWAEAIEHFTAAEVIAQATEPERLNQTFYFEVGAACERKGDYVQAEKYFEKCLNLAPDDAEAQNYLGYMYAEQGMKLDRAKELVQKAVRSEPKNPAYLDSLGWILFKLRQPQEALGYILKAIELSEKPDPTLYDHLGDIYVALDQLDKARDAWRKSIALDPDSRVLGKLELSGPR